MKKTIVLNWKCFPTTFKEAELLLDEVCRKEFLEKFETVVYPPFVYLEKALARGIKTGAQNCFWEKKGPFTGEVSPLMLKNLGCRFVLLGHSERKRLFGELELIVNKKLRAALAAGLNVLLFFGEEKPLSSLKAREETARQLKILLSGLRAESLSRITFVYEPAFAVSARGGQALGSRQIRERINFVQEYLREKFNLKKTGVLYGGSVDEKNIKEYLGIAEVQGVVIGQASTEKERLKKIISLCLEWSREK